MSNRGKSRFAVWLANLAWFLSCLPGWIAFVSATHHVERTQARVLRRILRRNASTEFGRRHGFGTIRSPAEFKSVPLTEYEDYADAVNRVMVGAAGVLTADPVQALMPTSGSTQATKLIPYTASLRREFRAAIDAWVGSVYLAHPSLLGGKHYWSISPTTRCPVTAAGSSVPVGFGDDAEYLGRLQRRMSRTLFAVPVEVARVTDQRSFEYLTLLFLLRERNLRLISVWHPSFLTVLVRAIPANLASIVRDLETGVISEDLEVGDELRCELNSKLEPDKVRAQELKGVDLDRYDFPRRFWPALRLISCWTEGRSEPWVSDLRRWFPESEIQGKGLTATEGIVSLPFGAEGKKVCAVGSHFLEFIDEHGGQVKNAWELKDGRSYSVVLTTSGGLYRYRLHDLVRVTGFHNKAPCLEFISRDNLVSDLVGEKLNACHVEACLRAVEECLHIRFTFAMVAPGLGHEGVGYALYLQLPTSSFVDPAVIGAAVENRLRGNYHYQHARRLGQLLPLRVVSLEGDAMAVYRRCMMEKGMKAGDIKVTPLSKDSGWSFVFGGAQMS